MREVINVKTGWNRPKFAPVQLRRWLKKEDQYQESAKLQNNDRRSQGLKRASDSRYPEIEYCLTARLIWYLRILGIPVETWMLEYEGK